MSGRMVVVDSTAGLRSSKYLDYGALLYLRILTHMDLKSTVFGAGSCPDEERSKEGGSTWSSNAHTSLCGVQTTI